MFFGSGAGEGSKISLQLVPPSPGGVIGLLLSNGLAASGGSRLCAIHLLFANLLATNLSAFLGSPYPRTDYSLLL